MAIRHGRDGFFTNRKISFDGITNGPSGQHYRVHHVTSLVFTVSLTSMNARSSAIDCGGFGAGRHPVKRGWAAVQFAEL
jgi:hypothetical protein